MIAPAMRTAAPRASAPSGGAIGARPPADGDGDGAQDPETPATVTAIEARLAALIARASTPQDEALERQREEFDFVTREQAESDREINALRDMAMEQMKQDDELLKKWIALI